MECLLTIDIINKFQVMSIKTPVSHLMLGVLFLELCIVVPGLGQTLVKYDGPSVYERDKMNQVLLDEINWYRTNPKSYQKALNADNESWDEKIKVKKKS